MFRFAAPYTPHHRGRICSFIYVRSYLSVCVMCLGMPIIIYSAVLLSQIIYSVSPQIGFYFILSHNIFILLLKNTQLNVHLTLKHMLNLMLLEQDFFYHIGIYNKKKLKYLLCCKCKRMSRREQQKRIIKPRVVYDKYNVNYTCISSLIENIFV